MVESWYKIVWLAVTLPRISTFLTPETVLLEKSNGCGRVWITISSRDLVISRDHIIQDPIELNWDYKGCSNTPKQIGMFHYKPTSWINAIETYKIKSEEGYILTNATLGATSIPTRLDTRKSGQKGPKCLWPWVGAGNEDIVAYNCFKMQPTWMEDNIDDIGNLRIGELVIPGTHHSGAFGFDSEISALARDSFVLCQDQSLWAQLVYGIRFLDLRIGYYDYYEKEVDRYWVNYNLIRVRPLKPILKEINTFLSSTSEVVFLDIHQLTIGFYEPDGSPIKKIHMGLLELVHRELEAHLADAREFTTGPGNAGPTLQTFIKADRRLLLSYVDNIIISEHNWLWPAVPHLTSHTNSPIKLFTFLDSALANQQYHSLQAETPLYATMVQVTPTIEDVLFQGSIRISADEINRNVTERLDSIWRNQVNIIATDFFLANGVIDLSITINVDRADLL